MTGQAIRSLIITVNSKKSRTRNRKGKGKGKWMIDQSFRMEIEEEADLTAGWSVII